MASTLPRFLWGWEVTSSNNRLDFVEAGSTYAATLDLGTYLPAEFAAEVQRAMREIVGGGSTTNTCTFSFTTRKFTLGGTATFSLLFNTGANAASDCSGLLGFSAAANETGATSYASDDAVGAGSSTAFTWAPADPVAMSTPVTAAADGSTATLLQRAPQTVQNVADGGLRETIYFRTDKMLRLKFGPLTTGAEQASMESLLDWIERGRRVNYQPDATSTNALRLVLANPGEIAGTFPWLTRGEIEYPEFHFIQSLSRT